MENKDISINSPYKYLIHILIFSSLNNIAENMKHFTYIFQEITAYIYIYMYPYINV